MRKALTITLLAAALALSGCSSDQPDEQTATKPTVTNDSWAEPEPEIDDSGFRFTRLHEPTKPDDGLPPEQYNSAIAHLHDSQRHSALFVCGSDDGKVTDRLIC
jgi:hypothetical protein